MNQFVFRAAMTATAALFAYHVITASAVRLLGMMGNEAVWLDLGVHLMFFVAGYVAARRSDWLWIGVVTAIAAGAADGLAGWRIVAAISGHPRFWFDHEGAAWTFLFEMLMISGVLGSFGALVGKLSNRIRPYRPKPGFRSGVHGIELG